MKEPYGEGVASHPGPESCGCAREGAAEALTGESAGEVLSRENYTPSKDGPSGVPTLLNEAEGNTLGAASARHQGTPRGRRPSACTDTPCTGAGRCRVCLRRRELQAASGSPRT